MQVYHRKHFTNEREGITDEKNEVGKYLVSRDHLCLVHVTLTWARSLKGDGSRTKDGCRHSKVVFWHAMGGATTKVVDQLVANFNASQDKVQVEAVYQGTYDDLLSKLKASMGSNEGPSVVQMYEIGDRFMIDSS